MDNKDIIGEVLDELVIFYPDNKHFFLTTKANIKTNCFDNNEFLCNSYIKNLTKISSETNDDYNKILIEKVIEYFESIITFLILSKEEESDSFQHLFNWMGHVGSQQPYYYWLFHEDPNMFFMKNRDNLKKYGKYSANKAEIFLREYNEKYPK